jgi:hypothetical protein
MTGHLPLQRNPIGGKRSIVHISCSAMLRDSILAQQPLP